jgi:hypothetical protein
MRIIDKIFNTKSDKGEDEDQLLSLIKPYLKPDNSFPDGELRIQKSVRKNGRYISGELERTNLRTVEDMGIFEYLRNNYGGGDYKVKVFVSNHRSMVYQGTCQYNIFSEIEVMPNDSPTSEKQLTSTIVNQYMSMVNKVIENLGGGNKSEIETILMKKALEQNDLEGAVKTLGVLKELMGGFMGSGNPNIPQITEDSSVNGLLASVINSLSPFINALAGKLTGVTPVQQNPSPTMSNLALPGEQEAIPQHSIPSGQEVIQTPIEKPQEKVEITDHDIFEIMFISPIVKLIEEGSTDYERIATMIFGALTHTILYFKEDPHPALENMVNAFNSNDTPKLAESYLELSDQLAMNETTSNEVKTHLINLIMQQGNKNAKI